ncbi:MAG: bifunctional demethylmenaquinone methyltransferase/2-methoxy-6-polyprenyl-1,4-benzoquinol methylase UbiE [Gammaproteobacteria bacterium]|nr:bifunctional demethylmenaquinone methyltransferase/2-methoxy-6-polyprenyl-1,4-benzoquinol methylase UbiE [Gammaproteobacteria bacterium]
MANQTTHFGFERVSIEDKAKRVAGVFDSVATRYDLMNDLMSFGIHRLWKRYALTLSGVKRTQNVLDLAGGTGDLAARLSHRVGRDGEVVLCDINSAMLECGRDRLIDGGHAGNLYYVQADAERLPFDSDHFDCVMIAFGLRNVTDKQAALKSIYRILKPGGRLLVLEFSKPHDWVAPIYDTYSFKILPLFGKLVAGDSDSYRYLAESIRMHPNQEELKEMMAVAGFERCEYFNLTAGIVALHRGYKL